MLASNDDPRALVTVDKDLRRLTPAERLRLARWALGLTLKPAAERSGFSVKAYARMELGEAPVALAVLNKLNAKANGRIPLALALKMARYRSHRELRPLARAFGVSHVTYLKRERAGDARLLAWWRGEGWRFLSKK